jgi:hypothetical protein
MADTKLEPTVRGAVIQSSARFEVVTTSVNTTATEYEVPAGTIMISVDTDNITFSNIEAGVFASAAGRGLPVLHMRSVWFKAGGEGTAVTLLLAKGV